MDLEHHAVVAESAIVGPRVAPWSILHQLSHIKVNIPATCAVEHKKVNLASVPVGPFPLYSIVVICNPGLKKNKEVIIY